MDQLYKKAFKCFYSNTKTHHIYVFSEIYSGDKRIKAEISTAIVKAYKI